MKTVHNVLMEDAEVESKDELTSLEADQQVLYVTLNHRRTGIFLPGGAVNHLPKKITQVAQIFTKESKRNESHIATK